MGSGCNVIAICFVELKFGCGAKKCFVTELAKQIDAPATPAVHISHN